MSQIDWRKVRNGLNKTVFTSDFWEGADFYFGEACKRTKEATRAVFGLTPYNNVIVITVSDSGIFLRDTEIGHRAKRSIMRKIGRYLRDNDTRTKLGKCDEYLQWRSCPTKDEVTETTQLIKEANLEYLGYPIKVRSDES